MKSSMFNVFVPAKNGYCIYNTLNQSVLFCDEELKNALESNPDVLPSEYGAALKKVGVILDDTTDELLAYKYLYDCKAFETQKIQFVVITTYKCNLACPYCYEGKGEVYSQKMDHEMAEKIMKAMKNRILHLQSKFITLILFGGEPLLNFDVGIKIVKEMGVWCKKHDRVLRTFMVTNGTLLTKEICHLLRDHIDGVQLTVDGPQVYHDTTRIYKNGKGTYTDVIRALKTALECGIDVSLRVQISKENCHSMDQLFQDLKPFLESGKVTLNIAPLSRYSGICSNFSSQFLEKEDQETVLPAVLQYNPHLQPGAQCVPCVAFSNSLIFDGNGDIYKCITTVGEDKRIGYISDKGIVFEPELYTFMGRDPLKIPECSACCYLPLCGGGCPREAFLTHGTYQSAVCGGSKKVYYEMIAAYVRRKFPERF